MALLHMYCDSNFSGGRTDRLSKTVYVLFYHGSPIMWRRRKQKFMAISTAEADYIALAASTQQFEVIKTICRELDLMHDALYSLKTDNLAVFSMLAKPHGIKLSKFIY